MSRMNLTTQDLLLRLGKTAQSRSARADAVFRKLRLNQRDQIADALSRAPARLNMRALTNIGVQEKELDPADAAVSPLD